MRASFAANPNKANSASRSHPTERRLWAHAEKRNGKIKISIRWASTCGVRVRRTARSEIERPYCTPANTCVSNWNRTRYVQRCLSRPLFSSATCVRCRNGDMAAPHGSAVHLTAAVAARVDGWRASSEERSGGPTTSRIGLLLKF